MIILDSLKWLGQWPRSKHVFAMHMKFFKQDLSLMMHLRCSYDILSRPEADESLQLIIVWENSSSENLSHVIGENKLHSFRIDSSMLQNWAELKDEWRACQRSFSSKHEEPLCLIVSIAGSFFLLTQFISSHGPRLSLAISWIFRSKNSLFESLTVLWNVFQLSTLLMTL